MEHFEESVNVPISGNSEKSLSVPFKAAFKNCIKLNYERLQMR